MYELEKRLNCIDLYIRYVKGDGGRCCWIETFDDPSVGIFGARVSPYFESRTGDVAKLAERWADAHFAELEQLMAIEDAAEFDNAVNALRRE